MSSPVITLPRDPFLDCLLGEVEYGLVVQDTMGEQLVGCLSDKILYNVVVCIKGGTNLMLDLLASSRRYTRSRYVRRDWIRFCDSLQQHSTRYHWQRQRTTRCWNQSAASLNTSSHATPFALLPAISCASALMHFSSSRRSAPCRRSPSFAAVTMAWHALKIFSYVAGLAWLAPRLSSARSDRWTVSKCVFSLTAVPSSPWQISSDRTLLRRARRTVVAQGERHALGTFRALGQTRSPGAGPGLTLQAGELAWRRLRLARRSHERAERVAPDGQIQVD
jgi:hypothetical protein